MTATAIIYVRDSYEILAPEFKLRTDDNEPVAVLNKIGLEWLARNLDSNGWAAAQKAVLNPNTWVNI